MTPDQSAFERAAWSWVEHLRQAGTTPWAVWVQRGEAGWSAAPATGGRLPGALPGAAELELVRRLAERTPAPSASFTALADHAFGRSGPGRGLGELPLLWPAAEGRPRFGPPPVDPAQVPDQELIRVGTGVLADLLLRDDPIDLRYRYADRSVYVPSHLRYRRETARHRFWQRSFRLAGAPVTASAVRAGLLAGGRVPGGRRPTVLLFARPLEELLTQVWSARVQAGAHVRWPTFVNTWAHQDTLPPAADLAGLAARWASRVGPRRVHVVLSGDDDQARRTTEAVLGLPVEGPGTPAVAALTPAATDLVRGINVVLDVKVLPDRRAEAVRRLLLLLHGAATPALAVPEQHRDWLTPTAATMTEQLRRGGYAVHGDPGLILTGRPGAPRRPLRTEVLALTLDACLQAAGAVAKPADRVAGGARTGREERAR